MKNILLFIIILFTSCYQSNLKTIDSGDGNPYSYDSTLSKKDETYYSIRHDLYIKELHELKNKYKDVR